MPATIVLTAIFGDLIMAAAALGSVGYAAAVFGIRLVTSYVVSKLFAPSQTDRASDGVRVQLPPATNNKIPVAYGQTWMRPIITDAKISLDQTQMWYVCTLCETPNSARGTTTIGDIYWGDKKLNFDPADATRVESWTDLDNVVDTRVAGLINVYMYNGGSSAPQNTALTAIQVLQNAAIDPAHQWAATDRMNGLTFIVVRVTYNGEVGLTGLDNLNIKVTNSITKPGDCLNDYLLDDRYGCDIPPQYVNAAALTNLNTYSDQLISYTDSSGNPQTQARYRINGPLDTGTDCFRNLQIIAEACDSWIQWNEATAQWGVVINKSYLQAPGATTLANLFNITDDVIIGGIDLNPVDLNNTYNRAECEYPDGNVRDNSGFAYIDLDTDLINPNEPDNVLGIQLPVTNNNVTAKYIATRRLLQSREDLIISFTMDYSGMQIDAGDVVKLNSQKFGWVDKLFRVAQVVEGKDNGNITVIQITANEYNETVYSDFAINEFVPSTNTGITDPNYTVTPDTPTITNQLPSGVPPRFTVNSVIPLTGAYNAMEVYMSNSGAGGAYVLIGTAYSTGSSYTPGSTAQFVVNNQPAGTLYFRVRLRTITNSVSDYSGTSLALVWNPV